MKKLLEFEYRKLLRSKAFYICLFISMLSVSVSIITIFLIIRFFSEEVGSSTSLVIMKNAFGNGMLSIIGGIFISIFVCEDDSLGTIKNIYARGYSKVKVNISKYLVSLTGYVIMYIIDVLLSFVLGLVFFKNGEVDSTFIASLFAILVLVTSYHSIFFLFASVFRKLSFSIASSIVFPNIMTLILTLIDSFSKLKFKFSDYWIDNNLTFLTGIDTNAEIITRSFILGFVVIIIALTISNLTIKRKQV